MGTTGEHRMAIEVRDQLQDAVARVLGGGPAESVTLRCVAGYTGPEVALHIGRGVYLATWGRPVSALVVSGPGGVAVVVSKDGAS